MQHATAALLSKGLKQCRVDPTLFYIVDRDSDLVGYLSLYIDDAMFCGTAKFIALVRSLGDTIEFGTFHELRDCSTQPPKDSASLPRFLGLPILFFSATSHIVISMSEYAYDKVKVIQLSKEDVNDKEKELSESQKTSYRAQIGVLSWLAGSCKPALSCITSMAAGQPYIISSIVNLNKVISSLNMATNSLRFVVLNLNQKECYIYCYADASLFNNLDHTTQSGFCIFLGESYKDRAKVRVNLLDYNSGRLRRVVKSTFAAELMALDKVIDRSIYIRNILLCVFEKVNIVAIIDNASVVEAVLSMNPRCTEKKLLVAIAELKQLISENSITLYHCLGIDNPADVMTKTSRHNNAMSEILSSNLITVDTFFAP